MPRSFLVKKPCTTRGPNYGRLETRLGRPEPTLGLGGPLFLQDGTTGPAAPIQGGSPWDGRRSVIACLSPPLPPKSDPAARGPPGDAGAMTDSQALDFRDHQNRSPLPLSLPQRRTPSLGSPAEGEGSHATGEPDPAATAAPLERLGWPDCPKPCGLFLGLGRHTQQQHRCRQLGPARKYFSCKYCEKEYVSLGALKMHIRTHTLPCVCKSCGKAFSRPWLLQGHIRTHTGEKPYACSHCSRAFADRSNLRAHLQTHSEIKKYQCHTCLKTFSRMSLLLRHEEASCSLAAT